MINTQQKLRSLEQYILQLEKQKQLKEQTNTRIREQVEKIKGENKKLMESVQIYVKLKSENTHSHDHPSSNESSIKQFSRRLSTQQNYQTKQSQTSNSNIYHIKADAQRLQHIKTDPIHIYQSFYVDENIDANHRNKILISIEHSHINNTSHHTAKVLKDYMAYLGQCIDASINRKRTIKEQIQSACGTRDKLRWQLAKSQKKLRVNSNRFKKEQKYIQQLLTQIESLSTKYGRSPQPHQVFASLLVNQKTHKQRGGKQNRNTINEEMGRDLKEMVQAQSSRDQADYSRVEFGKGKISFGQLQRCIRKKREVGDTADRSG